MAKNIGENWRRARHAAWRAVKAQTIRLWRRRCGVSGLSASGVSSAASENENKARRLQAGIKPQYRKCLSLLGDYRKHKKSACSSSSCWQRKAALYSVKREE